MRFFNWLQFLVLSAISISCIGNGDCEKSLQRMNECPLACYESIDAATQSKITELRAVMFDGEKYHASQAWLDAKNLLRKPYPDLWLSIQLEIIERESIAQRNRLMVGASQELDTFDLYTFDLRDRIKRLISGGAINNEIVQTNLFGAIKCQDLIILKWGKIPSHEEFKREGALRLGNK